MSMPSSPRQSPRGSPPSEVWHPAESPESTPRPPPEDSSSGERQHQDSAGRPLFEEWIQQADDLANALPEFSTFAEALEPLAAELHGFGGADAGQVQTMLGQLKDAPVRLRATGLAGPPENDAPQDMQSEQWWKAVADLFQAAEDLTKASASTATAYRQLQDR